jgi:hypothetical protein
MRVERKNQWVVPVGDRWGVRGEGNRKLTRVTDTQKEAVSIAKDIARNQGSRVVIVQNRQGEIRSEVIADSALEQEIVEAVRQLDEEHQQRVLEFIHSLSQAETPLENWVQKAHEFRMAIRAKYGDDLVFNSLEALDESREERLDDIMGSS